MAGFSSAVPLMLAAKPTGTNGLATWLKLLNCRAITILLPVIPLMAGAITTHWVAVSTIKSLIRQLISKHTLA